MLPLFDDPKPEPAPVVSPDLEAALARAEALRPAGGWPYLIALREVNGWASGYHQAEGAK